MRGGPGGALLALLLLSSCAPSLKGLAPAEREEAARFFRERWGSAPHPFRASFSGTADTASGRYPVLVGVEALSPGRETVGVFDPFGHEVIVVRNDGSLLAFQAGPLAGPLAVLDDRALPVQDFSLGRLFAGLPAFEPKEGEYLRGEGGEWVHVGKEQTLRTDRGRKALEEARYRLFGREVVVRYPGRDGSSPPAALSLEGGGASVAVRRDPE